MDGACFGVVRVALRLLRGAARNPNEMGRRRRDWRIASSPDDSDSIHILGLVHRRVRTLEREFIWDGPHFPQR